MSAAGTQIVVRDPAHALNSDDAPVRNQLLAALGAADFDEIKSNFEVVRLENSTALFGVDGSIDHVYFPENAVVSLVSTFGEGRTVEVGVVGREGMAGLTVFLAGGVSSVRAFTYMPGIARRMDAEVFRRLSAVPGPFHQVMLRYTHAFLDQVRQTAMCNKSHRLEERCACWLLAMGERVDATEFPLTHEFLSLMLGVRGAGVILTLRALHDKQLIRWRRGRVEIVDALGLERACCECFGAVKAQYTRLLTRIEWPLRVVGD